MKKKGIAYLIASAMLVSNIASINVSAMEIPGVQSVAEDMEISEESENQGTEEQMQYNEFSDGYENEDESKEENNVEETETFSAQEDLIVQGAAQNEAEGEKFSAQEKPEMTDGSSENVEVQFSSNESDIAQISAKADGGYGYTVDSWLASSGTRYSMEYLGNDVNFPNTAVVSLNDSNFGIKVTGVASNLIYRGCSGWKELFFKSGTKEEARKVLVALMENQGEILQGLGDSQAALECANIVVDAIEETNYWSAVEFGLTDSEIQLLKGICTNDKLAEFFLEGKYDSLSEYFRNSETISKNPNILKFIENFEKSSKLADECSKLMKGFKATVITAKTLKRIYEIERLKKADDLYSEMLMYIKEHISYEPIEQAAQELYNVIHNGSNDTMVYAFRDIQGEAEGYVVDEILGTVIENIPYAKLIYKSYKYSVDLSNELFNVSDIETQRENMRCVAYIGHTIALWMKCNLEVYESAVEDGDSYMDYAIRTIYAYDMLVKARIAGEKSLQKMMQLCGNDGTENDRISKVVLNTLESTQEYRKNMGILIVFEASPSGSAVSKSKVQLTASAIGGSGTYTYKFLVYSEQKGWHVIRDYASSNTCIWTPGSVGKKTLYVDIKDNYGTVERAEIPYEVKKPTVGIKLNKSLLILNKGKSAILKATVTGTSSKVIWKSSNTSVATVTSKGKVIGKRFGTCTITAIVNGKKATCRVIVGNSVTASTAYKKLIQQYEKKYGKAKRYYYTSDRIYWKGLCFAKLLDLNNDNTNELILAYQTELSDIRKVQYHVELWTFDGKKVKKIASQISWTGNNIPFYGVFSISEYTENYLLNLMDMGCLSDRYYGTKNDGSIGLVDEFIWKGDIINGNWYHNGTEISQDIFDEYRNKYSINQTEYIFWKTEYEEIIKNEIAMTKKTLKM